MRAAVAVVLARAPREPHLLLIRRAEHPLDPWSGHMAFPGGRLDPTDETLVAAAIRETREEVGIDLEIHGALVTRLDDLQASARGRNLDLVVSPFLFTLEERHEPRIDPREVAEALWVPLHVFRDPRFHGTTAVSRGEFQADFPAYLYEGNTVWGMTYRMIQAFLGVAFEEEARIEGGDGR
jgi:8-oxo-dGTP pyrophosphatase MutT (NUDIX family)